MLYAPCVVSSKDHPPPRNRSPVVKAVLSHGDIDHPGRRRESHLIPASAPGGEQSEGRSQPGTPLPSRAVRLWVPPAHA